MLRRALAIVILLTLAGCESGADATIAPVDDAFDGMVTDVVRIDFPGGFVPLAVAPDGAVAGVRYVSRGPLIDGRADLIVVEQDGEITVIVSGLDDDTWPLTLALSESTVAWVSSSELAEDSETYDYRLFSSPRIDPQLLELTEAVSQAGGSLEVYEPALHVVGDTVIAAGGPYDEETTFFAVSTQVVVRVLALDDVFGIGAIDGCANIDEIRYVHWGREPGGSIVPWEVVVTRVPVEGTLTSERVDISGRDASVRHHIPVAACGENAWYTVSFGEERFLERTDTRDPSNMQRYPLPIANVARLWTHPQYVVGSELAGASFVLETSTGKSSTNFGGWGCNTVDVNGDVIMWRDGSQEQGFLDGGALLTCPTYVGRLAPVEG